MLGEPCQAERHQQQVQYEELLALAPDHDREPPAHHDLPADQQHRQQDAGLQRRQRELAQQRLGRRAERRDQHQQRHHRQVLEQQHAHDAAAVLGLELEPLGHQLDDDRGAAHRKRAAERHRALPAEAPRAPAPRIADADQQVADQRGQHRQADLAEAEAEHQRPHAAQLRQVEFEADHEHQEHDAELGEVVHRGRILRERHRVRADQHADREVAEHRRQLRETTDHHACDRGDQEKQDEFERRGHAKRARRTRAITRERQP